MSRDSWHIFNGRKVSIESSDDYVPLIDPEVKAPKPKPKPFILLDCFIQTPDIETFISNLVNSLGGRSKVDIFCRHGFINSGQVNLYCDNCSIFRFSVDIDKIIYTFSRNNPEIQIHLITTARSWDTYLDMSVVKNLVVWTFSVNFKFFQKSHWWKSSNMILRDISEENIVL